jgi:hypothetical protein
VLRNYLADMNPLRQLNLWKIDYKKQKIIMNS